MMALLGSVPEEKHGRGGLMEYNTLGYIPYGIDRAGNRTVEYSYDDSCIAQVAKGLGFPELYDKYMKRSHNWRNLWRSDYEWQGMKGFIMRERCGWQMARLCALGQVEGLSSCDSLSSGYQGGALVSSMVVNLLLRGSVGRI